MSPQGCLPHSLQPLGRPRCHALPQPLLQPQPVLLCLRRRPIRKRIFNGAERAGWFDHQLELRPIQLGHRAGVGAAEHGLDRLAAQPKDHRQKNDSTGDENVLHAD